MGHHHHDKDKAENKPHGSSVRIFWRLFKEYARPYWFRLMLGILAGMIMGGAMHLYLSFMSMGVSTLEAGFGGQNNTEKVEKNLVDNLADNRLVKWVLDVAHIDLQKDVKAVQEETNQQVQSENTPDSKKNKNGALFRKINDICRRFGINVSEGDAVSFPLICILIGCMLFFFTLRALGEFINKYFLRWVGAKIVADLRYKLFENFQHQSIGFFANTDVGSLISRCTYDAGVIDHAFAGTIADIFIAPVQIFVALEFLVLQSIRSNVLMPVIILILSMPLLLFPLMYISKLIRDYQKNVLGRISDLVGIMQENFTGIRVVKAFNSEAQETVRFQKKNAKYFKAVIKSVLADIFTQPVMQIVAIALGSVFLILCFHFNVSLGVLAVLGYSAQQAYKPIKELAKLNINLQKCAAATERIFESLDLNTALPEPEKPVKVDSLNDAIRFENVNFTYDGTTPIINDFSLEIKKGQFVAIVGSTGSGKSTVANLMARFYDPCSGKITIDGIELKNISNENIRKIIGIVSQENFLFNETIANNIKYGKPQAEMNEIQDAAERANAMDFINDSPEGFKRNVGERGCQLSGGQRQRIAIARAILKNPPILILDEATSALDTVTEQAVQKAITQLMKERTVLAIAHRLSTVVNADQIVVLEQGRIVEQGTHQQLYDKNGTYRHLYDMQTNN